MTKVKPQIGVIGAGRWGKNHIKTLASLGFLGGIVDTKEEVAKKFAQEYPDAKVFTDYKKAVLEDFAGFTVATPAETHAEIAEFLLKNKKHVLVEKPIALNAADARRLQNLAIANDVNLMVGHVLLFHPAIKKIKELVENSKIGKLQYLYSNRLNLGTVRKEENILWSFAPHDISIFQHLIGEKPLQVDSCGGIFLQPDIHDTTLTVLKYPNNIIGHIFLSWLQPFKEHRLVVIGSKGMISFDDSSDKKILFYEKGIDWVKGEPIKRDGPTEEIFYDNSQPLTAELDYFARHLNGDKIEIADSQNAVDVLEILEEATKSLMQGQVSNGNGKKEEIPKEYFAHATAFVDEKANIGKGTRIWHQCQVQAGAQIGENCTIGHNCFVASQAKLGNGVKLECNIDVWELVTLEDDVFVGPSAVFTNDNNPRAKYPKKKFPQYGSWIPTLVKEGASIGANATIVCGVTIGKFAFIGAGAVVTKDVPDYALVVGNPGRQIGWMDETGQRKASLEDAKQG